MPIRARPCADEPASAASIEACSSRLIERATLRIQNTMEVSTATATRPTMASNSSCVRCGNSALTSCSPAPTNSDAATASNTPSHTAGIQSPRPVWTR